MRIDLHVHTTASDGLLDPGALVRAVTEAGVQVFGLADHDTVDAIPETLALAEAAGLQCVPGIEISAYWGAIEFHILGYYIDPAEGTLTTFLQGTRKARHTRMRAMLSRLGAMGIPIPEAEVLAAARNGNVGRPHLARVLVEHGVVDGVDEAFERYLGAGRPAYVPRPDVTVAQAISVIHGAGGLAVVAHPGLQNRDDAFPDLLAAGLDGIEVYHPKHNYGLVSRYRRLAGRHQLLITGGSDFHGVPDGDHASMLGRPCLHEADFLKLAEAIRSRRETAK
ncbi:MAG: PHP domain-containing protein [candidate division NC10 bacterium]|nr:PHP domain-containing protein [candidate division NC10 bacterium]